MSKKLKTVGVIIPDVHEQVVRLKAILRYYADALWFVFLGDFMDTFKGLTWETFEMVKWLAANARNPKYTLLWGNHDIHYAFPIEGVTMCSGFDKNKLKIVQQSLDDNDHWKAFKLMHWIGTPANDDERGNVPSKEFLCSHAGMHVALLNPIMGFEKQSLLALEEEALYDLRYCQTLRPLLAPGKGRGGWQRVGGVDWLDWDTEFQPINGLNQIVGHSYGTEVRIKQGPDSYNYCLDTHLRHVIEVKEDGTLKVVKVKI
jgi:hypothetical protein